MNMDCELTLKVLAMAAGTFFWMWYLVWEYEHFRAGGKERTRWWERDLWKRGK